MQIRDFRRTQCLLLAFAVFGMPSGFAQQANVPAATVASAPSQNANADSQTKAIEKDGIYEVGGPVKPPKIINSLDPKYTKQAKRARLEGACILLSTINRQGVVENIQVLKRLGIGLDENAIAAARNFRFQPATLNDQPVPVHMEIKFFFSIIPENNSSKDQFVVTHQIGAGVEAPKIHPDGTYEATEGVTPPKLIKYVAAEYPDLARQIDLEGICVITMTVNKEGIPENVHVTKSLEKGLDNSALNAVRKYRFRPAMFAGKPLPVRLTVEVQFHSRG